MGFEFQFKPVYSEELPDGLQMTITTTGQKKTANGKMQYLMIEFVMRYYT